MNFYGHVLVAHAYRDEPAFLLGSMLPDFAGMAGLGKLHADAPSPLAAGIGFHHDTDAVFHRAPVFVTMTSEGIAALEGSGVGRGTARAVAHVGLELLLDGLLLERPEGPGLAPYQQALAVALEPNVLSHVKTDQGAGDPRFVTLIERLRAAPVPERYREPTFVAERLQRMLAARPRLAMVPNDRPAVDAWLVTARVALAQHAERLWEQVHEGLREL